MSAQQATPADAGCWVAGHHGHYAGTIVIDIARQYGWDDAEAIALIEKYPHDMTEHDNDIAADCVDDAEAWLNENVAPDSYSFGWYDGEFFLQADEWWQE